MGRDLDVSFSKSDSDGASSMVNSRDGTDDEVPLERLFVDEGVIAVLYTVLAVDEGDFSLDTMVLACLFANSLKICMFLLRCCIRGSLCS